MSRQFFFTVSALLFLSLFGKLAWEVHKESTRTALNDLHVIDPYFMPDTPPYTKQVYEITVAPAAQADSAAVPIGMLIREVKQDDSPNTILIIETYHFGPPGSVAGSASGLGGLELQSQTALNSLIGLQNVEWNAFLQVRQALINFGVYFHLKAGPPSNDDMPVRSEIKFANKGLVDPTAFLPDALKLSPHSGDAPSQLVKADDFQLGGICFSPFTQRAGVALYDNWPVKYLRPEDLRDLAQSMPKDGATPEVPYRRGRVVITNEVDVRSPSNGETIKGFRAVCKLERRIDDAPGQEEFRLEAIYLPDGTVFQVQTITGGYRLMASLQHKVVNMKKSEDPEPGRYSASRMFDHHKLYVQMFPEVEMEESDADPGPGPGEEADLAPPGTKARLIQDALPADGKWKDGPGPANPHAPKEVPLPAPSRAP